MNRSYNSVFTRITTSFAFSVFAFLPCAGMAQSLQASATPNVNAVAILKWNAAAQGISFPVPMPNSITFDGASMWVVTPSDSKGGNGFVTKLRASDGLNQGKFAVGNLPVALAFDGANIWVADRNDNTVSKLSASDGTVIGTYKTGKAPSGVVFDGQNIWITNFGDESVTKLRASDGSNQGVFFTGAFPADIAFDGASIWISNQTLPQSLG
jgi:outer membrane lipoprotein-sorting protein